MCPFHEKDEVKKEDEQCRISSLALGAFISLIGLTIVVTTQNYGDDTTIKILLFSMFIVLISGIYGKSIYKIINGYFEKRRYNKLAKSNFEDFKKLVIRFKEFTENHDDNIQLVTHSIKNNTPEPNPFNQINVIDPIFFQDRYNYYNEGLNRFDGTKDSLTSLAKEFESILFMYDKLYINDTVNSIRNIGRDEVPLQFKESYNKARLKYIDFLNSYKKFAKNANEDFKEKEETFAYGGKLFKDFFDPPEEL